MARLDLNSRESLTLLDYARAGNGVEFRPCHQLTKANGRRALFDSRVIWASAWILQLWNDRSDIEAWKRFAANVEVLPITAISTDWPMGL